MNEGVSGSVKGCRPIRRINDKYCLRMCWGEKNQPFWCMVDMSTKKEIGITQDTYANGMSIEHLNAQMGLRLELLNGRPIKIRIRCDTCKTNTMMECIQLEEDQDVKLEWQVGRFSYDVAVVPKNAPKHTEAIQILEVHHTSKTKEDNRPQNVPWYEVSSADVAQQMAHIDTLRSNNSEDATVMTLDCRRTLTKTCKKCIFEQLLEPYRTYLKSVNHEFQMTLKKHPRTMQAISLNLQCVLCDECSSKIVHSLGLCEQHWKALVQCAEEGTDPPSVFFKEARGIIAKRSNHAKLQAIKQAKRLALETLERQEEEQAEQFRFRARQQASGTIAAWLQGEQARIQARKQAEREAEREAEEKRREQEHQVLREKRALQNLEDKRNAQEQDERIAKARKLHEAYALKNKQSGRWPEDSNRCKTWDGKKLVTT